MLLQYKKSLNATKRKKRKNSITLCFTETKKRLELNATKNGLCFRIAQARGLPAGCKSNFFLPRK